jgi:segregation and condensation protein A
VSEPIDTELAAPPETPEPVVGEQQELPLAFVHGKPLTVLPRDLYIPPEALEVFLEAFEGPLDLLLYLIRRQNLDILEINVAQITEQYMQYVELMDAMQFELAAEYLVMSAMLAEIKSRMLLPRQQSAAEEEADPRADLILRRSRPQPQVELRELLLAFGEVARRASMNVSHHVQMERLSTRERMVEILARLHTPHFVPFVSLFRIEEGRMGVVVTFLAIMELIKESLIEMVQSEPFGPIHVKPRGQDAVEVDH